jgi:hypothetical protein
LYYSFIFINLFFNQLYEYVYKLKYIKFFIVEDNNFKNMELFLIIFQNMFVFLNQTRVSMLLLVGDLNLKIFEFRKYNKIISYNLLYNLIDYENNL